MSFSSTCPNHATFHFRWTLLAATPNNMIIGFIITPTSQSDGVSMSASSRRSRYDLLRTLYHKASLAKWFNKRFLAVKLNNMILRLLHHKASFYKRLIWCFNIWIITKALFRWKEQSAKHAQLRMFSAGSQNLFEHAAHSVPENGVELFWFPENKATSRFFACSLKEITVLW